MWIKKLKSEFKGEKRRYDNVCSGNKILKMKVENCG
jgi:hypothetical protein